MGDSGVSKNMFQLFILYLNDEHAPQRAELGVICEVENSVLARRPMHSAKKELLWKKSGVRDRGISFD